MDIRKIQIKFLKDTHAPQQVFRTNCECCGPEFQGMEPVLFLKDEEIDPDALRSRVDLTGLKLGEDYVITEFVPETPSLY